MDRLRTNPAGLAGKISFFRAMRTNWKVAVDVLLGAGVILAVYGVSSLLLRVFGLRFPASIAGMFLLFALMASGLVPMRATRAACRFLLSNMAFFFLPILVAVFFGIDLPASGFPSILAILIIGVFATMAATAFSVEFVIKRRKPRRVAFKSAKDENGSAADCKTAVEEAASAPKKSEGGR